MTNLLEEINSSSQWEVQLCSQGALVFFLLSFGFRVGRFFFSSCIWCGKWIVQCPFEHLTLDFPCKFYWGDGGEGGGFIFLSANRKGQSALLLFLLS